MTAKKKFNSLYDHCDNASCDNFTIHRSGVCAECRTYQCMTCGKRYTSQTNLKHTSGSCAECKRVFDSQVKKSLRENLAK